MDQIIVKEELSIGDMIEMLDISRTVFWKIMQEEDFPEAIDPEKRNKKWDAKVIQEWLESKRARAA